MKSSVRSVALFALVCAASWGVPASAEEGATEEGTTLSDASPEDAGAGAGEAEATDEASAGTGEEETDEAAGEAAEEASDEAEQAVETGAEAGEAVNVDSVGAATAEAAAAGGDAQDHAAAASAAAAQDAADEAAEEPGKPWSVSLAHSFGFGLQVDDTTAYSFGSLSANFSYKILKKLSASLGTGLYYTLDGTPNDARRLDFNGFSLGLNHASLYKDEDFTGINVSGGVSLAQPMGMGFWNNTGTWPTLSLRLGLSRKVGPVGLSYGLGFAKMNPVQATPFSNVCATARGSQYCIGGYGMNWSISNSLSASYSPIDDLSLSAGFAFNHARSFAPNRADEYTHYLNVDTINNRRDSFGFSLSATYSTPVKGLSAGLSFSNGGPWRSNGQQIYNPVFDPRLASMSVDVSYGF